MFRRLWDWITGYDAFVENEHGWTPTDRHARDNEDDPACLAWILYDDRGRVITAFFARTEKDAWREAHRRGWPGKRDGYALREVNDPPGPIEARVLGRPQGAMPVVEKVFVR
jgi:hypothetical protein